MTFVLLQGGAFIFQLMDFYSASGMSLLWVCFFQTIAISWFFGAERFCDCVEEMIGTRPHKFWTICWVFLAPAVMLVSGRDEYLLMWPVGYILYIPPLNWYHMVQGKWKMNGLWVGILSSTFLLCPFPITSLNFVHKYINTLRT